MFERETRRVKLLEGRIREIKLKMAQEKPKMPMGMADEEEEEEEEAEEEEERKEMEVASVDVPSEITEEGEEEQSDVELMAIRNKFFEMITDEEMKRKDKKYTLLTRTAFDPNFLPTETETKYMPSSPKIVDDATRLAELKAMIEEKKAARKVEASPVDQQRLSKISKITFLPEMAEAQSPVAVEDDTEIKKTDVDKKEVAAEEQVEQTEEEAKVEEQQEPEE